MVLLIFEAFHAKVIFLGSPLGVIIIGVQRQKSLCDPPRLIYDAYIYTDKGLGSWKPEIDLEQLPQTDFLKVVKMPLFIQKIRQNAVKIGFFGPDSQKALKMAFVDRF